MIEFVWKHNFSIEMFKKITLAVTDFHLPIETIIKTVKTSIKIPLAHIGNHSFNTGLFPMELKIAKIVPIFKSGEECIFTNYRPVSVLPIF